MMLYYFLLTLQTGTANDRSSERNHSSLKIDTQLLQPCISGSVVE